MIPKINPELKRLIDDKFDDVITKDIALTYAMCTWAGTIITLYQLNLFKEEADEEKYRILLVDADPEVDGSQRAYKLKMPLFVDDKDVVDEWDDFYKYLVKNPRLITNRSRFVNNAEGKEAFKELLSIKDFDMGRLKAATESYYMQEGQYAKNLTGYLQELAMGQYMGFREKKSNMV